VALLSCNVHGTPLRALPNDRILIAEDEPRCCLLEKVCWLTGSLLQSKDGHEAVAMADSSKFDLLLLDPNLPGKDGWMVLEECEEAGVNRCPSLFSPPVM